MLCWKVTSHEKDPARKCNLSDGGDPAPLPRLTLSPRVLQREMEGGKMGIGSTWMFNAEAELAAGTEGSAGGRRAEGGGFVSPMGVVVVGRMGMMPS